MEALVGQPATVAGDLNLAGLRFVINYLFTGSFRWECIWKKYGLLVSISKTCCWRPVPRPDGRVCEPADVVGDDPGISRATRHRGLSDSEIWRHPKVLEDDMKRVNQTSVPQVNMRICGGEFEPMVIQLEQG